jgi:hypothetical protein
MKLPRWLTRLFGIKDDPAPQPRPASPLVPNPLPPIPEGIPLGGTGRIASTSTTQAGGGIPRMTSGEPNDPGFIPEPVETQGMFGQRIPAAPYGRNITGTPFASMEARAVYFRALAVHDYNQQVVLPELMAKQMATGLWDPRSLTDDDLHYLMYCAAEMTFDPRSLGIGPWYGPEVGRMGSQKYETMVSSFPALEASAKTDVVKAVREMAQGTVLPWMSDAFPSLGDATWRTQHLASWRDGWKRLHPGQEP